MNPKLIVILKGIGLFIGAMVLLSVLTHMAPKLTGKIAHSQTVFWAMMNSGFASISYIFTAIIKPSKESLVLKAAIAFNIINALICVFTG